LKNKSVYRKKFENNRGNTY